MDKETYQGAAVPQSAGDRDAFDRSTVRPARQYIKRNSARRVSQAVLLAILLSAFHAIAVPQDQQHQEPRQQDLVKQLAKPTATRTIRLGTRADPAVAVLSPLKIWQYDALADALEDPVFDTQLAALEWLYDGGGHPDHPDRVPPRLLDLLRTKLATARSFSERTISVGAIGALGEGGGSLASDVALLLKTGNTFTPLGASIALGKMPQAGASFAPDLAALLESDDMYVRIAGMRSLAQVGAAGKKFIPQIAARLKDKEGEVRRAAAMALGNMGEEGAAFATEVAAMLNSADSRERDGAVWVLGRMGERAERFAPNVAALLKSEDRELRWSAARSLARMGKTGDMYLNGMADQLKDLDADPTRGYAQLMARTAVIGEAFARLNVARLNASDVWEREAAARTLVQMGALGAAFAPDVAQLLKDDERFIRGVGVKALAQMGEAGAQFAPEVALILKDDLVGNRQEAALALGQMGDAGATFALDVAALLKDESELPRRAAAKALAQMGEAGAKFAPDIATLLKDSSIEARLAGAQALEDMASRVGPIGTPTLRVVCLDGALANRDQTARFRLTCHLLGPKSQDEQLLMQWVTSPTPIRDRDVAGLEAQEALRLLTALDRLWPILNGVAADGKPSTPSVLAAAADLIQKTASSHAASYTIREAPMVQSLIDKMNEAGFTAHAAGLREVRDDIEHYAWLRRTAWIALGHAAAWALLIWAYPRSRWIQTFVFWNPWARRFLSLGYVSLLITWVAFLRRRMFIPFRSSLVPQGALLGYDAASYFPDSDVAEGDDRRVATPLGSLREALPDVKGQVVLEGDSGVGKTMALRRLASISQRIAVLLRANECTDGVMSAIQSRLHGHIRDKRYLRSLIHAGAMDVLIDGLNEAPPDTRSRIVQFVEESFQGNFILTTQSMEGVRPRTARVLHVLPLRPDQIERFLIQQWPRIRTDSQLDEKQYREIVGEYLSGLAALDAASLRLEALSNPMEASLVAELLGRGERPDLLRLIDQCYSVMEAEFRRRENRPFPYRSFAEHVYAWRLSGRFHVDPSGFEAEVAALVDHKIMITRILKVPGVETSREETRWWFRHDKLVAFALLPAFMNEHADRRTQHLSDQVFFGVYELLATKLSEPDEAALQRQIQEHAANARDGELLYRYTIAKRSRSTQGSSGCASSAEQA